jgi:hypothetical protein
MECNFQVGDKVVCIDASLPPQFKNLIMIIAENKIYTVERIFLDRIAILNKIGVVVYLKEVQEEDSEGKRLYFKTSRFRPLVSRNYSLSLFQEIVQKVEGKRIVEKVE